MGRPISLYTDAMAKHRPHPFQPAGGQRDRRPNELLETRCEAKHEPEITLPKEEHDMTNSSLDTELLGLSAVGTIEVVISSSEPVANGLEDRGQNVECAQRALLKTSHGKALLPKDRPGTNDCSLPPPATPRACFERERRHPW